ncbi:hypothetical protein D3C80_1196120 [compost metagenome]
MAKADSPIAHTVLDIFISIDIPDMAAVSSGNKTGRQDRVLVVALGIGMGAARYDGAGALAQSIRVFEIFDEILHGAIPGP